MTMIIRNPAGDEVRNQAPPLPEFNLFEADLALQEGLARHAPGRDPGRVSELGRIAGSGEARQHARRAEQNLPRLHTHDGSGRRIDEVECDPSFHWLLRTGLAHGVSSLAWRDPGPGAHAERYALGYLWGQLNTGVMCPLIMTFAAVPVLRTYAPELAAEWVPRLTAPVGGAVAGQAFTEKQGGSDLRGTTTRAVDAGDGTHELWGHKWFVSAPMADVFLTLARTDAGLSCFLVERGPGFRILRLKDKLGTRALPTAEVEFHGVRGRLVGSPGRGMAALVRNVGHARLGPAVAPEMRAAVVAAIHHCRHRRAFGARLADQPLMKNVLADLAIESESATATSLRLAAAYEDYDSPLRRLATTVQEYAGCGRVTGHVAEAMQCLGGNGYSESSGLPRLVRDAAVHPIWEGSGNVIALDILRVLADEPEAVEAFLAECELARGGDARLDAHLDRTKSLLRAVISMSVEDAAFSSRKVVEDLATAFSASLLVRFSVPAVADAYCAGRLGADRGLAYGTLPKGIAAKAIIDRAAPL